MFVWRFSISFEFDEQRNTIKFGSKHLKQYYKQCFRKLVYTKQQFEYNKILYNVNNALSQIIINNTIEKNSEKNK